MGVALLRAQVSHYRLTAADFAQRHLLVEFAPIAAFDFPVRVNYCIFRNQRDFFVKARLNTGLDAVKLGDFCRTLRGRFELGFLLGPKGPQGWTVFGQRPWDRFFGLGLLTRRNFPGGKFVSLFINCEASCIL